MQRALNSREIIVFYLYGFLYGCVFMIRELSSDAGG